MELDNVTHEKIVLLTSSGDDLIEEGKLDEALLQFKAALELVPSPKENWKASTWIYASIGDVCFLKNKFKDSLNYFLESMKCPEGMYNPFILLRIGQCFFETDNISKAKEYLLRSYMLAGLEIFSNEDDKYQDIIKQFIPKLDESTQNKIDIIFEESDRIYESGKISKSVDLLKSAWEELPDPKYVYDESYHIAYFITKSLMELKDYTQAKEWAFTTAKCDPARGDVGEKEFLIGQVFYEKGEISEARKYFEIAKDKSEGRCFQGEDKIYRKLIE